MTRNVVHIYTREIDFNLELDIEFLGIRMLKGTPEYYEWLDKFLQKRKRKTNDTSSTNRIAREIFEENSKTRQSLEKAGDAAGPVFKELVSLLQGMQGPNAKDKSRENALKEQIYLLRNKAKDYNFDISSLEEGYTRIKQAEGAESLLYLAEENQQKKQPTDLLRSFFVVQ